jgi:hypothetical protein
MGGRKGYSLRCVVGDLSKVRTEKRQLLDGIKAGDVKTVVASSARIMAKSDDALDAIVHGLFFVRSMDPTKHQQLADQPTRERRLGLADQWSTYRKKMKIEVSPTLNREIVDTAARVIGRKK